MAVYRWVYANAKMEGNRKDYHVRVCDPALGKYKRTLILLSNRLLSTEKRYDDAERQNCWFSGHVDEKMYVIAVGGDQKELLGISPDGYRNQHCVLGYGLTENDIQLFQKDEALFEPLKEIMRQIQRTGEEWKADNLCVTGLNQFVYADSVEAESSGEAGLFEPYNIIMSTEETDSVLWKISLQRPVMTGIISVEDAKRLLRLFPNGIVTVMEDVKIRYYEKKGKNVDKRQEEAGIDSTAENVKRKKVLVTEEGVVWNNSSLPEPPALKKGKNPEIIRENVGEENGKSGKVLKRFLKKTEGMQREDLRLKKDIEREEKRKEEKQKKEKTWKVNKCAEWCKNSIPPEQRECIEKVMEQLRVENGLRMEDGFLEQIENYGYMFFWHKRHNKERWKGESYTYYALKIWAENMGNEQEALEYNFSFFQTVRKLKNE